MTGPCFVDANVIVYALDRRDERKHRLASDWLDTLWRDRLGRTSTQVISEAYSASTRKLGIQAQHAWDEVARFFAWNPQAVDETVLRRARENEQRYRLAWWDSLIVAAAQVQDCALLLTEDLQDGVVFGAVTVRSPFTLQVNEAAVLYRIERRGAPLHRPRGRPKRLAATA